MNPRAREAFTFLLDQASERAGISRGEAPSVDKGETKVSKPTMFETYRAASDVEVILPNFPIPGFGILAVNAFVLVATEPVVRTSWPFSVGWVI